jgi:hypothetical protein
VLTICALHLLGYSRFFFGFNFLLSPSSSILGERGEENFALVHFFKERISVSNQIRILKKIYIGLPLWECSSGLASRRNKDIWKLRFCLFQLDG